MKCLIQCDSGHIASLGIHRNPGLEIVYLERGELEWQIEGHVEKIPPQSIFFSLPWQEHGSVREYEPGHLWHYVLLRLARDYRRPQREFAFHPELGFTARESRWISRMLCATHQHDYMVTPLAAALLPLIVREAKQPGMCSEAVLTGLTRALIVELARIVASGATPANTEEPASLRRVSMLIERVAANPGDEWTLERMARECQLGRTQFATLLKRKTGDSPITFVNRMRIQRAMQLLRETDRTITDIAFECGFNTSQYFAKVFKSFVLCDARTYRERARRGEVGGPPDWR